MIWVERRSVRQRDSQSRRLRSGEFIRRTGAGESVLLFGNRRPRTLQSCLQTGAQTWAARSTPSRRRLVKTKHHPCFLGSANKLPSHPLRPSGCLRQTISLRSVRRYADRSRCDAELSATVNFPSSPRQYHAGRFHADRPGLPGCIAPFPGANPSAAPQDNPSHSGSRRRVGSGRCRGEGRPP